MNFVIWTMQRSGGVSFARVLGAHHPAPTLGEPFHKNREYQEFPRTRSENIIGPVNIRHCYELFEPGLNDDLERIFEERGYYQMLLIRRDEVRRMESVALARRTRAFGPESTQRVLESVRAGEQRIDRVRIFNELRHLGRCLREARRVKKRFAKRGWPVIYYEDFYAGKPAEIENRLDALLDDMAHAGVPIMRTPDSDLARERYIRHGRQRTADLLAFVPNRRLFRTALKLRLALDALRV